VAGFPSISIRGVPKKKSCIWGISFSVAIL